MKLPKIIQLKPLHFWLVTAMIIILPVIREYRLLLFGERIQGTVIEVKEDFISNEIGYSGYLVYSEIEFFLHGKRMIFKGPENFRYEVGEKLPLIVMPQKPEKVIIATISGFYLHKRSIGLIIVFFIWLAIYSTLKEQSKTNITYFRKSR